MTDEEYVEFTKSTGLYPEARQSSIVGLTYCALGIVGEAGEIAGKVKKIWRGDHGNIIESFEAIAKIREQLLEEAGDAYWYLISFIDELGSNIGEVRDRNVKKLSDRKTRGVIKGSGDNR
jgi:NTP pyrophosphatase (non-canonical NTP hydrolase)